MQARGVQFHDLASDEGQGILAGAREAQHAIPLRVDLFNLLREAYRTMEVAERAQRAEREAQAPKRRRGKALQLTMPREQTEVHEKQAMATYDLWVWLMSEVRQSRGAAHTCWPRGSGRC